MSKQPEALRIASVLESEQQGIDLGAEAMGWAPSAKPRHEAAAELRRQHVLIEEMRTALQNMIEAAGALQNTCGAIHGDTPEDSDTFTHDKWAEDFLRETASESLPVLAKAEAQQ